MRDKLSEAVKVFDAILKPDGRITYLATPQNQESLYNKLPDREYKVSIWPARHPNPEQLVGYGSKYHLSLAMHWQSTLLLWVNLQTLTASQILTCSNGKHPTDAQVLHCSLCSIQGSQMQKDTLSRCLINRD